MRWFTIYFLGLAVLAWDVALLWAGHVDLAIALPAVGALLVILGWVGAAKPLVQILDILSAFVGTGWGVWRSLRGDLYQTWTPAASIRR